MNDLTRVTFDYVPKTALVNVPGQPVETYRTTKGWREFLNIVGVDD